MSEEEKIERLLNSIAKGCDGSIADEVKALIIKQQKEIEEKNVAINKMSKDISRQLKEIEKLNFENHMVKKWNEQLDKNCISKDKIREIRDKAEVMDYYSLNDVIDDLSKLIGDYEEDE